VYILFFTKDQFGTSLKALPTADDQAFIWNNLEVVGCFYCQRTPVLCQRGTGEKGSPWSGVEESLPLLLTASLMDA